MAKDRTTVSYHVSAVYKDDGERKPSNTVLKLQRIESVVRVSETGAYLGERKREYTDVGELTPDQAAGLAAKLLENLAWMAEDSLRWAKQLEAAGVKPEEL